MLALTANATAVWLDIPFVAQPKEGCGAAVISMVMQFWAKQQAREIPAVADVARIQSALYSREARGIRASDMKEYFERGDFDVHIFRGAWDDIAQHVGRGRPLVVSLAPDKRNGPLHFVVVAGVDAQRGYVFLNDPARGKLLRSSREAFEGEWKAGGNWTLLALPHSAD